jgi:predicted dehydrogenase
MTGKVSNTFILQKMEGPHMSEKKKTNRREFLRTVAGGIVVGAAVPLVGKRAHSAAAKATAPSERVNIGIIGVGWRGGTHLKELVRRTRDKGDVQVTAVSDLYEPRLEGAKEICGGKGFRDYHDLLAQEDVDGVIVAVPWHWHAKIALDACNAGKDVYVETPMTIDIADARKLYETAEAKKRVVQVGNQMASFDEHWRAKEVVESGVLGKLLITQASWCRNSREGQWNYTIEERCSPENLDWETWQGAKHDLAPPRDFSRERFFRWRKFRDYGGGSASDLLCHTLGCLLVMIGREFPQLVTTAGGQYVEFDRDIYDTYITMIEYPRQHMVVMDGTMINEQGVPEMVRGHEATCFIHRDGVIVAPESPFAGGFKERCEEAGLKGKWGKVPVSAWRSERQVEALRIEKQPRPSHMDNFLHCIRTRETPVEDAFAGYQITVAVELGVQSYYKNKTMHFDPEKQVVLKETPPRTHQIKY